MKHTNYPPLYKGKTKWTVEVDGNVVRTVWGQPGGKLQRSEKECTGVNIGKTNERTPEEQAMFTAKAMWEKKLKSGYTTDPAGNTVDTKYVKGGVLPMLAHKYEDYKDQITGPVYIQPKLDGIRCIAVVENGKCTLWTRTRKPITSCPHIVKAIEKKAEEKYLGDLVLDGELYNHTLRDDFQGIVSAVRRKEPSNESLRVQYHIYDIVSPNKYYYRQWYYGGDDVLQPIKYKYWDYDMIHDEVYPDCSTLHDVITKVTQEFISQGYEGAMVRWGDTGYESGKRSKYLLKVKYMDDGEFKIVDIIDGVGKMRGAAILVCCVDKDYPHKTFTCVLRGSLESRIEMFNYREDFIGQYVTVRHQGWTNEGLPRFPVGIAIRNYE